MKLSISQSDAVGLFDLPTEVLYVCDGKRGCGTPRCVDHSRADCCHHTADESHALYETHRWAEFERHPAIREDGSAAAVICVEPIR